MSDNIPLVLKDAVRAGNHLNTKDGERDHQAGIAVPDEVEMSLKNEQQISGP
jgi:hypothetical protein